MSGLGDLIMESAFLQALLEVIIRILERLGFKNVRTYTTLGCLAVALVTVFVGNILVIGAVWLVLYLLGLIRQLF